MFTRPEELPRLLQATNEAPTVIATASAASRALFFVPIDVSFQLRRWSSSVAPRSLRVSGAYGDGTLTVWRRSGGARRRPGPGSGQGERKSRPVIQPLSQFHP